MTNKGHDDVSRLPACLNQDGSARCGLPAEVRCWYTMSPTGGPLESATIKCPAGHWFNEPIEFLTPGKAANNSIEILPQLHSAPNATASPAGPPRHQQRVHCPGSPWRARAAKS